MWAETFHTLFYFDRGIGKAVAIFNAGLPAFPACADNEADAVFSPMVTVHPGLPPSSLLPLGGLLSTRTVASRRPEVEPR